MKESATRSVALAALVAVGGLLLAPVPAGWLGLWQDRFLDFGHVLLFATLVLALRTGLGVPLGRALLVAVAVAGLAELVQPWFGRSGRWADFLRGCLGALAAAAAIRASESRRAPARFAAYLGLAVALPAWPVVEVAPYAADAVEGRRVFPVLAGFSTDRELLRWECDQAVLTPDGAGARLDLLPGSGEYSSAALRPVVSDFGGYRWLCCEFRVVGDPLELVFSVRTGAGDSGGTTHAQVGRRYAEGRHVARVDLEAMAARARPSPLVLSDVRYVQLFVVRPRDVRTVFLSRVWLEP